MLDWWNELTTLNQAFYCVAAFFSVFFVWQLIAAIIGLAGDADIGDSDASVDGGHDLSGDTADAHDATLHHGDGAAVEAASTFKMLSVRSIITFFTLFSWGSAMYIDTGVPVPVALGYAVAWGCAGMLSVAGVFYFMLRLSETGTRDLNTAVGTIGTVYADIPADGEGEVRVMVGNTMSFVRARSKGRGGARSGTPMRVVRRIGPNLLEVEPLDMDSQ